MLEQTAKDVARAIGSMTTVAMLAVTVPTAIRSLIVSAPKSRLGVSRLNRL